MELVLFEDAMKHICKISRIVSNSGGHALLVGVGGSGKQSLSRLSSAICQFTTYTIVISSSYGMNDLKLDLQKMYLKSGQKDEGIMFLFTEGQITNERFLVFINDLLSSGEIADLFPTEDIDNIVNAVRGAVKSEGLIDNKDNCWRFFLDRVRKNLHMSLCFSPVGDDFRNRSKKFPALINNTVIDWFHPWPQEALLSVADKFLESTEMPTDEVRQAIVKFMPFSFTVVNNFSEKIK
jgi:dynein heavy chain